MNDIKKMLKSVWFASLVRQVLSGIAALLAKRGYDVSGYVEPILSMVIVIAVAVWSNYSHKRGAKVIKVEVKK